ncbi:MAG: cysteine desulfurase family protein, partial [Candidatus Micrarchaeota archaeon]
AVLNACAYLEKEGFEVTYVGVSREGLVNVEEVKKAVRADTILISIMHANNEIGTIQPIEEIGKFAREHGIVFHSDGVQTLGKIPIDVKKMNVDLMSFSSHKLHGPKGVGALYMRKGVKLEPLIYGGNHEKGMRAGTENVAGIVGFAKAAEIAQKELPKEMKRIAKLRDELIKGALKIKGARLHGSLEKRLPGNINVGFPDIEGEALVLKLDAKGIAASTGSACSSHSLKPSHVLIAIGLKPEESHGSLRLTLGRENDEEDVKYVLKVLPEVVEELTKMSPFGKREEE